MQTATQVEPELIGFLVNYEEMADGGWREASPMFVFEDAPILNVFPRDAAIRNISVKREYRSVH